MLTNNARALEDSLDRDEPMIWIQMDIKSFFDRLVREIDFACMKGNGIPERAVPFYKELYTIHDYENFNLRGQDNAP